MKRIYKYPLNTFGLPTKIKEKISRILSIQLQRDQVCVWIEIDDDAAEVTAEFLPIGTGLEFPKELTEINLQGIIFSIRSSIISLITKFKPFFYNFI